MTDQKIKEPPKPVIMKSWMCKCGVTLPTYEDYEKHKESHRSGAKMPNIDPVTGENLDKPEETKEPIVLPKVPSLTKPEPTISKKVKLNYRYDGNCDCGKEVETIELEDINNDNKHVFVVAWCGSCKKKLQQNYVVKI